MSDLPTSPMEDHKSHASKKHLSKSVKPLNRASKRPSTAPEHQSVVLDGRHKRVWKACERCRMKKTKCDGESPCKRCKDDGLVCTAGSRKKTEFKQLPRGYAEVLENTQYALIATVQKLYTMIRNGESWELGDPELNDRGQPVVHDIASKLGCIRPSPDLPYAFPEGENDFADLQAQLVAARSEIASEDMGSRKYSEDSTHSGRQRTERASSSESEHSNHSQENNFNMIWKQKQQPQVTVIQRPPFQEVDSYSSRPSLDTNHSPVPSPIYTEFQTESPMFCNTSPFSLWSGATVADDFLAPTHALDLTAHHIGQQQGLQNNVPRSSPLRSVFQNTCASGRMKMHGMNDGLGGCVGDGTIRPGMLDCNTGFDVSEGLDSMMFGGDFDGSMTMTA